MNLHRLRIVILCCFASAALSACGGGSDTSASSEEIVSPIPINQAPSANGDSLVTDEDSPLIIALSGSDSDGTIASYNIVTPPENGALLSNGSTQTYTPNANFHGTDSFTFTVSDNDGLNSSAVQVNIMVNSINDTPTLAESNSVTITDDMSNTFYTVLAGDTDQDVLSYKIVGGADAALFSIDAISGEISFVLAPSFNNPQDANQDNIYELQLAAFDGELDSLPLDLFVSIADNAESLVHITYPKENSNLGGGARNITLVGTLNQNALLGDLSQTVASVDVNGIPATLSNDKLDWRAEIPITMGNNGLNITVGLNDNSNITQQLALQNSVTFGSANVIALHNRQLFMFDNTFNALLSYDLDTAVLTEVSSALNQSGPSIAFSVGLSLDDTAERAFLTNDRLNAIYVVEISSGENRVLSSENVGTGPLLNGPQGSVYDANTGQLLLVDSIERAVFSIDVNTGDRRYLSNADIGTGDTFSLPTAIALDSQNNRVLVVDIVKDALFAVDLGTGNRNVVSGLGVGTGDAFEFARHLSFDSENNRAFVSDSNNAILMEVDLLTGNRTVIASSLVGSGVRLEKPLGVVVDTQNNRILVADENTNAIVDIALNTNNREVLLSTRIGSGPLIQEPYALKLDNENARVLLTDRTLNALLSIDVSSGNRSLVSSPTVGSGDNFSTVTDIAIDHALELAYVSDVTLGAVFSVDLSNGNRSVLFSNANFTEIQRPNYLVLDKINEELVFTEERNNTVFAYSLASQSVRVISDDTQGSGASIVLAAGLALDAAQGRLLVINSSDQASEIIAIDLNSGDRTVLASDTVGSGPSFDQAIGLSFNASTNNAMVINRTLNTVMSVDLQNGNRSVVSDGNDGFGSALISPNNLAFDSESGSLWVSDSAIKALFLIEESSGDRTILSK